ncbi:MAG: heparinase II/III domain-containing protein [Planctomycetota bacterium]
MSIYGPLSAVVFAVLVIPALGSGAFAGEGGVLAGLKKEHPRLLFTKEDEARVRQLSAKDPLLRALVAENRAAAEWLLTVPLVERKLRGPRLLSQSRNCIRNVWTSAMAWRLHGDRRFLERAKKDMFAAAAFKDWNPSHFLDVAEMTAALAVGYDWLHADLTPGERARIRKAIVEKGLKPGMDAYRRHWFPKRENNWNQVCNGGLTIGALAVAEDEPKLAADIVSRAVKTVPKAMASYKPDGAWYEGPAYWGYATSYNSLLIAVLDDALGRDFGLPRLQGFSKAGEFVIHGTSPSGLFYSYADCRGMSRAGPQVAMFWLARKFERPDYAWYHRGMLERQLEKLKGRKRPFSTDRFRTMEIAWFDERGSAPRPGDVSLDRHFRGIADVVTFRGAWGDPDALWVGFKGGYGSQSHGHMDIGSFELDADGVRWAMDLGSDDYNLPGYWDKGKGGRRWKYYRLTNRSHNTLVIGGKLQDPSGKCKVRAFSSQPARASAVLEMTPAYRGQVSSALRGVAVLDRCRVLVVDEIRGPKGEVRWGMVTRAEVELDGAGALLKLEGKTLLAEILEPAGTKFEIVSTDAGDRKQRSNEGTRMLAFKVKPKPGAALRLAVLLTPVGPKWKKLPPPKLEPLAKWPGSLTGPRPQALGPGKKP